MPTFDVAISVTALPYLIAFCFGAIVGSFLNVCIHRLPRYESVVWTPSHCPSCGTAIRIRDNVPLVSFVMLRGRCRACARPISWRYPVIELLNGVAYAVVLWRFGFTVTGLGYAAFVSALLVVSGTDLTHRIIPDAVTIPGTLLGLVAAATILPVGWLNAFLGVLVGGGLLWFAAWISPYLFGREGMGGGDIKLLAMVGAFLGWQPALLTILMGAVIGSVVGVTLIVARVIRRDTYLPFGPFLAGGAVVAMLFHQPITEWYGGLIQSLL